MQLTIEERQAVENGQPMRCVEQASRLECVVLRADLFERVRYLFDPDPSAPISEMHPLLANFEPEDWKDLAEWKAPSPAS
jgi:hypothetical protein